MNTLVIYHVEDSDPPAFEVHRLTDGKRGDAVEPPPPAGFPIKEAPQADLAHELQWYLERFLDYPFPPETDRAERLQAAMKQWGQETFKTLFDNRQTGKWYEDAVGRGLENLQLQISSDDPRILAWPWEALHDPQRGYLALGCHIERRLSAVADPVALSNRLPKGRINILLVTARPFEADVRYRSISRPLVELIETESLPADVTVLRPPTFEALREHLHQHSDHYHILHFDGHGAYLADPGGDEASPFQLQSPQGHLVFETDDGKPKPIQAEKLSELLREYRLPAVVLNACQSGMVDHRAEDAYASVAASLIRAGIRSVVAMAYSLYVSGAEQFLPAFYKRLFETGDLAAATRAGRQQMYQEQGRVCARGTYPLDDWLVPLVYQQQAMDFSFAVKAHKAKGAPAAVELPEEARDTQNPYGLIGRDKAILEMERAMRRPPAGILICGLGGIGKTTLARGFIHWLSRTGGLGNGCFWFTFNDIHSAEFVLHTMGTAIFGAEFITGDLDQKIDALGEAFKENPFLIVWDNFESASGVEGAGIKPLLSGADRKLLREFLQKLRDGKTKVIITSRSEEDWLGSTNRFKLALGGLSGEERWEYCRVILRDLGKTIDQSDPELVTLMDALEGHPLLMHAVLPMLDEQTAASILQTLQHSIEQLGLDKTMATLSFVEQGLPQELQPLLVPLSFHERFADADYLELMAKQIDAALDRAKIDQFLGTLAVAGLVWHQVGAIYQLHPALTGFLRSRAANEPSRDEWARAFVDVMGSVADAVGPLELHEQRGIFAAHGANFHHALSETERLDMQTDFAALTQSLAAYALNTRDFGTAEDLFVRLAAHGGAAGDAERQAVAYHQLGRIAQERRDFKRAQEWYLKSLAIDEKKGNEQGATISYHQLGRIAEERRDFKRAEKWYLKSLEITEELGIEEYAAATYHQLGIIAEERRDFEEAEKWYLKSLEIEEKLGDGHGAAAAHHQLGMIAQERGDLRGADKWYRKSLAITEKHGIEHGAAKTYHELGLIAQHRRDFEQAEKWYLKSLAIEEKLGDEHGAASTYNQLGLVARLRGRYVDAGRWVIKAIQIFLAFRDEANVQNIANNFAVFYGEASPPEQAELKRMWEEAGLGKFPPANAADKKK